MGRAIEKVMVQNRFDLYDFASGRIKEEEVRAVEIDAVVDTGATYLCLPPAIIQQLGLPFSHTQEVGTANGPVERRIFDGARITIRERAEVFSVMENDDTTPPLLGYVILEVLDFVVDPRAKELVPNPRHEGKWMADLY